MGCVRDRQRWLHWLLETKKRHRLAILNYVVTSNHIHLLVVDDGSRDVIPTSMQLVAGRTGQEYNVRKKRKGAYWEDRYHATAVESGEHLLRCIVYIDMNMVRAGVVTHPFQWKFGGFNEIQKPKRKCALINGERLCELLNFSTYDHLVRAHRQWVEDALRSSSTVRDSKWTESIAVGSKEFTEKTKERLGITAKGRKVFSDASDYHLREQAATYLSHFNAKNSDIGAENTYFWNISSYNSIC